MAEVAGIVIGGVGLAALFDSCMNAFEYVESGSKYGREYNKAALKISLLQLKLSRWKETVQFVEDQPAAQYSGSLVASPEEADKVHELLGNINYEFTDAERRAQRYQLKETPVVPNLERTDTTIAALTKKVQKLAKTRQKAASMKQKAAWALHDRVKFQRLIADQTEYINSLVELFPAMQIQQQALADSEAVTLAEPVQGEDKVENLTVLKEAAHEVDEVMEKAAVTVAQQQQQGFRHQFGAAEVFDKGRLQNGDFIAAGYTGPMHQYGSIWTNVTRVRGEGRTQNGDSYGGKSLWDD